MNGWAVGDDGYIFHTIDGGSTWKHQTNPLNASGRIRDLEDVFFVNDNYGWAVGEVNTIIRTTNGGLDWRQSTVSLPGITSFLRCVFFINQNVGWVGGSDNVLLKTEDGGDTWTVQNMDEFNVRFNDIYFENENLGYIAGDVGYFLKTTNGGVSWEKKETGVFNSLLSMDVIDGDIWVAGNQKIIYSDNGGDTWEDFSDFIASNYLQANFEGIAALSKKSVWAVGSYGYRIHTVDAGKTWYRQNSPILSRDFNAICKINDFVYAVGDSGVAVRMLR